MNRKITVNIEVRQAGYNVTRSVIIFADLQRVQELISELERSLYELHRSAFSGGSAYSSVRSVDSSKDITKTK